MKSKEIKEALSWVDKLRKAEEHLSSIQSKFSVLQCLIEDGYEFSPENPAFCDFNRSIQFDLGSAMEIVSEKVSDLVNFIEKLEEKAKENEYE